MTLKHGKNGDSLFTVRTWQLKEMDIKYQRFYVKSFSIYPYFCHFEIFCCQELIDLYCYPEEHI